jgi:hypothetical protein
VSCGTVHAALACAGSFMLRYTATR